MRQPGLPVGHDDTAGGLPILIKSGPDSHLSLPGLTRQSMRHFAQHSRK